MQKLLLLFGVIGLALATQAPTSKKDAGHAINADTHLLEIGHAAKLRAPPIAPDEIRVVSYNIRWRGGAELRKLAQFLKNDPETGRASILGLQEVDRDRTRTGNTNTAKALADELGMHYAWAAPPKPKLEKEEETGVLLLSSYPLSNVSRIVLPHEGPNRRRRVGVGATVKIGQSSLRVYSVHSETRLAMDKKLDQIKAVLKDLAHYPKDMPAIVMGDLNTWEPGAGDKTSKLFTAEGFHTPFDGQPTFSRRIVIRFSLKLDWIWLRNIEATKAGIDKDISLSDHWPLWVALRLKPVRG
ncbi:MAG: endonuclease/exonuclease/phosphatase family protein [Acidobacteriota bacterium]